MQKLRLLLIALVWVVFGSLGGSLGLAQEIPPERTPEDVIELLEGSPEARHLPGAQPEPNLPAIADQPEDFEVAWSRMAFETYRAGNWELYRINPDNTDELRLTYSPAIDVYPALIHGGNELLFSSDESGSQEIYRMNADGTNVVRLTYTGATNLAPVLSPDGSKIVFRSSLSGNADIFVMNADGTGLTQLTFSSAFDGMPDWSSDGSRIIFSSNRTGTYSLWIMDADGSNQALLYTGFYAVYPQWSPVNDVIAFTGDSDGDDFLEVWTVNADGSKLVKRIPNGSLTDMWFPVWSPDGKYLAFTITNWTVYQDEYYWTYSYLNLRDLQTGNMQSIAHYDNRIWRASWVSTDVQPPTPCTVTAPAHSNWTSFIVDLNAQDEQTGPGGYDAEARWNDQTSWTPLVNHTDIYTLTSNTTVNTIFHGPPSGQVEFRCRAYDKVGNLAPWPVTASAVTFVDTLHPTSSASTETPVVHGTSATISWAGTDPDGSVASFDLFVKEDLTGNWTLWKEKVTTTSAVFNGTAGHTYFFRSQARDIAGHVEAWQPAPDTSVTMYATKMNGTVTDARGRVIAEPFFQLDTPPAQVVVDPLLGTYQLLLSDAVTHTLLVGAAGFEPLDPSALDTSSDSTHDWVLTPHTELVQNGDLETGSLEGWHLTGMGIQTSSEAAHSGQFGLMLTQNLTETLQITQTLVLTSGIHAPTLSFLYQIPATLSGGDFEVLIEGESSLSVLSTPAATPGWIHTWADLSTYVGETLTLTFRLTGSGQILVDEVSIGPWETPQLLTVTPNTISGWEPSPLILTGDNFIQMPTVWLNGEELTDVTWDSPTQLLATVPAGTPRGTYPITIRNPQGVVTVLPDALSVNWHQAYLPLITYNAKVSTNDADWVTLGQNMAHTGFNSDNLGASRYSLSWTATLPSSDQEAVDSFAVTDGILVISNYAWSASRVTAFNAYNGETLWTHSLPPDVNYVDPVSIAHGNVYLQTNIPNAGFAIALDLYTGAQKWISELFGLQHYKFLAPLVTEDALYIGAGYGAGLHKMDASNGLPDWYGWGAERGTPAYQTGRLFGFANGFDFNTQTYNSSLFEVAPDTGEVLWVYSDIPQTDRFQMFTTPVLTGDTALVANNAGLYAININTHQLKWSKSGNFYKTLPATDGQFVYAIREGHLKVYNLFDGTLRWSFEGDSLLTYAPVIAGNYVYVASPENTYVLDRISEALVWQTEHGGWLAVANGFLYIAESDGNVFAYQGEEP